MSIVFLVLQAIFAAVYHFGDIGFDHPGRFGLSWNHAIAVIIFYFLALLCGLACSAAERNWKTASLQIALPLFILSYAFMPSPHYDAADHQDLIGKTKKEVSETLSSRGVHTAFEGHPEGNWEIYYYNGMTVYFGPDGVVQKVVTDDP
ncbi:MAG: hypothetical protein WEB58_12975 [Planctomycetaceae bacterium]